MNPPFSFDQRLVSMQSSVEGWELSSGNRTQNRAADLLRLTIYAIFADPLFPFGCERQLSDESARGRRNFQQSSQYSLKLVNLETSQVNPSRTQIDRS
jgi:hypothetical protein